MIIIFNINEKRIVIYDTKDHFFFLYNMINISLLINLLTDYVALLR